MPQDEKPKLDVALAKIAANLRPRFPKNQEVPTDEEIVKAVREYSEKHKDVKWKDLPDLLDKAEFLDEISKGILMLRAFEEEAALIGPLVPEVPGQERVIPKERPHALPEEPRMAIRDKDEEPEPVIPDITTTQKSPEVGIMPYGTRAEKPIKPVVKPVAKTAAKPAAEPVRHAEMRLPEQREIRRAPSRKIIPQTIGEKLRMAEPVQKRTRPRRTTEEEMIRQQEAQAQQQEQQEYEEMQARASMQAMAASQQQQQRQQEKKGSPIGKVAGGITGAAAAIILGGAAKAAHAASFYFLQKIIDIIT